MAENSTYRLIMTRFISNYGMLGILLILCILFSILTLRDQYPSGNDAAKSVSGKLLTLSYNTSILILSRHTEDDTTFAVSLEKILHSRGFTTVKVLSGDPSELKAAFGAMSDSEKIAIIATTGSFEPIAQAIKGQSPQTVDAKIVTASSSRWPTFLLPDNLRNVANQISVIAIIAIGMTMVIITAGIDLSVGSLIALSAVVTASLVGVAGGEGASFWGMILSGMGGIIVCGLIGAFSGLMITRFRIPPFIATLAMMQVAAGLAYVISHGVPVYHIPNSFILLGRGAEPFLKIPYAVLLMIVLYIIAHILMTRTTIGRYIYAVGGNMEAARLSGIRVMGVLFFVYTLCGILAGLAGVVMTSQLKSGAPTYGLSYELYVIAAVVVGGTSLSGGEGRIFGTLIGAFIISVIQNGMNLTNVESYTQKIVLGLVILGAVLLDRLKQQGMGQKKIRT
jgi:ribose transport system permease protein